MGVHEPATLLTDCLLAVLAAGCSWHLYRQQPAGGRAARWWARTLGLTAASAIVGGCYHGFAPNFPSIKAAWWTFTLLLICLMSAAMGLGLIQVAAPPATIPRWRRLIVAKFATAIAAVFLWPVFLLAIVDYGSIMVAWAVAAVALRRAWRGWMLAAIGCSVLAAVIQQLRWGPSPGFNHNDLYHVVQGLAILGFHRAGLRLGGPA